MIFNGIWFNDAWALAKTKRDFCEHEAHHNLDRRDLETVWNLIQSDNKKAISKPGESQDQESKYSG